MAVIVLVLVALLALLLTSVARAGPPHIVGGRVGSKKPETSRPLSAEWQKYDNWDSLLVNQTDFREYMDTAHFVFQNMGRLDWSDVEKELLPLLEEPTEYSCSLSLPDGWVMGDPLRLRVARPPTKGDKYGTDFPPPSQRPPAIFNVHTHPKHTTQKNFQNAYPSSTDLCDVVKVGSAGHEQFAVLMSEYGILVYGMTPDKRLFISSGQDFERSMLLYAFDVLAYTESEFRWGYHSLSELKDGLSRLGMFLVNARSYRPMPESTTVFRYRLGPDDAVRELEALGANTDQILKDYPE